MASLWAPFSSSCPHIPSAGISSWVVAAAGRAWTYLPLFDIPHKEVLGVGVPPTLPLLQVWMRPASFHLLPGSGSCPAHAAPPRLRWTSPERSCRRIRTETDLPSGRQGPRSFGSHLGPRWKSFSRFNSGQGPSEAPPSAAAPGPDARRCSRGTDLRLLFLSSLCRDTSCG